MTDENGLLGYFFKQFSERVSTSCSEWVMKNRQMGMPFPGPWNFTYFPWLKELHDSKAEHNVVQKAAQVGVSETVLNIGTHGIIVNGRNVLYLLPNQSPDATTFSSGRFDVMLKESPKIRQHFTDTKNVQIKVANGAALYIRGAGSISSIKSIPVSILIFDELDEMPEDHIPIAMERTAGQRIKSVWMVSNPTIPRRFINAYFEKSTQELFMFRCPSCSQFINLEWPRNIEYVDEEPKSSFFKCHKCKNKLQHETKVDWLKDGIWVEQNKSDVRGFKINQMYSLMVAGRPSDLATSYQRALLNPAAMQSFMNNKLGEATIMEGKQLVEGDLACCIKDFGFNASRGGKVVMGIDVGLVFHYQISEYDDAGMCRVLAVGHVTEIEGIVPVLKKYVPRLVVMDAQPEFHLSKSFAQRFPGKILLCRYIQSNSNKELRVDFENFSVQADRTSFMDAALFRFKNKTIELPVGLPREYFEHLLSNIRVNREDPRTGKTKAFYVHNDKVPDHYAHAHTYAEIASCISVNGGVHLPLGNVI